MQKTLEYEVAEQSLALDEAADKGKLSTASGRHSAANHRNGGVLS